MDAQPSMGKVAAENAALVSYRLAPAIRLIAAFGNNTPRAVSIAAEITPVPPR